MKKLVFAFAIVYNALAAQGTYYNSISPSGSTFITDLEARIRSPYTRITYDNYKTTIVPDYESRDTTYSRKVITCIYSGLNYVYTPPFAWVNTAGVNADSGYSREHTWCQSWMPTVNALGFESLPEYSDQHHLFPVNQNKVNVVRNNHPLGIVAVVSSSYLDSKFGTNASDKTVFEPRAAHKGDAARAFLYMTIRYNGISGYTWTFNNLNRVLVDSLSETTQDLATLLLWHQQDPPDKWEVDRNTYIESIQDNRNPFVDHPEYANYINFADLTKLSPTYATEPTNQPTGISVSSISNSSFTVSWTSAVAGTQSPSGYLIEIFASNNYFIPMDGTAYADDTNLGDGCGVITAAASPSQYSFSGLSAGTTYYVRLYSVNGSGTSINYKIDGTILATTGTTTGGGTLPLADEPTNYPDGYNSPTITSSSIKITWGDPTGVTLPTGYLLKASTTNSFTTPVSGNVYTDQTSLAGGTAQVNVSYGTGQYTFSDLSASTTYYFRLYPYNGDAAARSYKTESYPVALEGSYTTSSGSTPIGLTDLFISEYIEGSSNNKAIELYNGTASTINLTTGSYKLEIYTNGSASASGTINLTGSITSNDVYIVTHTSAGTSLLPLADQTSGSLNFNGNDAVVLKKGTTILDVIGQVGYDPGTQWGSGVQSTLDHTLVRKSSIVSGDTNPSDVFLPSTEWDGYATDTFTYLGSHTVIPLPVELISFSGIAKEHAVLLTWKTATEVNNYGFEVQRRKERGEAAESPWSPLGFVNGAGTTNAPMSYSFADVNAIGHAAYRLKQIDRDGNFTYSGKVSVEYGIVPNEFTLFQNYPNPFNPSTNIQFTVPTNGRAVLKIFNTLGQHISTLFNGEAEAGTFHNVQFTANGLAAGLYFARLEYSGHALLKKLQYVK